MEARRPAHASGGDELATPPSLTATTALTSFGASPTPGATSTSRLDAARAATRDACTAGCARLRCPDLVRRSELARVLRERREFALTACSALAALWGTVALLLATVLPMFVVSDVAIGDGVFRRNVCVWNSAPSDSFLRSLNLTCDSAAQTAGCAGAHDGAHHAHCRDFSVAPVLQVAGLLVACGVAAVSCFAPRAVVGVRRWCAVGASVAVTCVVASLAVLLNSDMVTGGGAMRCRVIVNGWWVCRSFGASAYLQGFAACAIAASAVGNAALGWGPRPAGVGGSALHAPLLPPAAVSSSAAEEEEVTGGHDVELRHSAAASTGAFLVSPPPRPRPPPPGFDLDRAFYVWVAFVIEVASCGAVLFLAINVRLLPDAPYPPVISDAFASSVSLSTTYSVVVVAIWAERSAYDFLADASPGRWATGAARRRLVCARIAAVQLEMFCLLLLGVVNNVQTKASHNALAVCVFLLHVVEECAALALRRDAGPRRASVRTAWLALEVLALGVFFACGVCFGFAVERLGCEEDGELASIAEYLIYLGVVGVGPGFRALD